MSCRIVRLIIFAVLIPLAALAQSNPAVKVDPSSPPREKGLMTIEDRNTRLQELVRETSPMSSAMGSLEEYRIGPDDLVGITVFDAAELNCSLRVSAGGEISMPLLGVVKAGGLTAHELELILQELLRRTYMKDPHVGVIVSEIQSHNVSVIGAVKKPGVFQIRGSKTLLEMLSMAEGLAEDAGDTVLVMRGAGGGVASEKVGGSQDSLQRLQPTGDAGVAAAGTSSSPKGTTTEGALEIDVRNLLESGDPRYNIRVEPGDIVKVTQAGVVYVVGEVKRPGGFPLKPHQKLTVLQALALGEGLTPTASKNKAAIIRTKESGERSEITMNLGKVLKGKAPDLALQSKDILFVPTSSSKSAARISLDAFVRVITVRTLY